MRTAPAAPRPFALPGPTLHRLRNAPARAVLWSVVFTLFLVTVLW